MHESRRAADEGALSRPERDELPVEPARRVRTLGGVADRDLTVPMANGEQNLQQREVVGRDPEPLERVSEAAGHHGLDALGSDGRCRPLMASQ